MTVYVTAPLCAGARQELARSDGHAGAVRVRAVCLGDAGRRGQSALAAAGADARRAAEDSATVGYIGAPDPVATRLSRPILESAGIASIFQSSGTTAMARLLRAIRQADGDSNLRQSVHDILR